MTLSITYQPTRVHTYVPYSDQQLHKVRAHWEYSHEHMNKYF